MFHTRALFAVGALLLAFASEGLQGLMTATLGTAGLQASAVGSAILAFLCLEVFRDKPPKPKRKSRAPTKSLRAPVKQKRSATRATRSK